MPTANDLLGIKPETTKGPEKVKAPTAQELVNGKPDKPFLQRMVHEGALPVAGGAIGAGLGAIASSPTILGVPAGVLAGEAVGSAAGEGLNQFLGITEPSVGQVALAGASGGIGRAIAEPIRRLAAPLMKLLPGASVPLQAAGVESARTIAGKYAPSAKSDILFNQLEKIDPKIAAPNVRDAVVALLDKEKTIPEGLQSGEITRALRGLLDEIDMNGGVISFKTFRNSMARIGQRTGSVEGLEANEVRGAFKMASGAFAQDLDDAAKGSGLTGRAAELLKVANKTYRKERAVENLGEYIEGGVAKLRGDGLESFNPQRAVKSIKEDKFLQESFDPGELDEIMGALKKLRGLPSLPAPRGDAPIGSGRRALSGLAGAAAGRVLGVPEIYGGLAGVGASELIAKTLQTDTGRRAFLRLVTGTNGALDHRHMAVLAQLNARQSEDVDWSKVGPVKLGNPLGGGTP